MFRLWCLSLSLLSELVLANCPKAPQFEQKPSYLLYKESFIADQLVWSEDQKTILGSLLAFRERLPLLPYDSLSKKDFCFRLFVMEALPEGVYPVDFKILKYLGDYRVGQLGRFYLQKEEGYILAEIYKNQGQSLSWEKLNFDGSSEVIASLQTIDSTDLQFIPSPDGKSLLRMETESLLIPKTPENEADPAFPANKIQIFLSVIDAKTLKPLFDPLKIQKESGYTVTWTQKANIKVSDGEHTLEIQIPSGQVSNRASNQVCNGPLTKSSATNLKGQFLSFWTEDERARIRVSREGDGLAFHCD